MTPPLPLLTTALSLLVITAHVWPATSSPLARAHSEGLSQEVLDPSLLLTRMSRSVLPMLHSWQSIRNHRRGHRRHRGHHHRRHMYPRRRLGGGRVVDQ